MGSPFQDDCDVTSPRTLLLVGRVGNGKSATGNSILGKKRFESKCSSSGVTTSCELETAILEDGWTLNVIDTPAGLFDYSVDTEFMWKEITSCTNMTADGIHAFLLVLSVRSRFSKEEEAAITSLLDFFGTKIYDYTIVVFTWGDELDTDKVTLEDFLLGSPETLKETLCHCGNRCVLFDNKTKDECKRANQVQKLVSLVNMVSRNNGGKPYTNTELKEQAEKFQALKDTKLCTQQQISMPANQMHDEQIKQLCEMVEPKLKETALDFERQLAEERAAKDKVLEETMAIQRKLDDEKHDLEMQIIEMSVKRQEKEKQEKLRRPSSMIISVFKQIQAACVVLWFKLINIFGT